MEKNIHLRCILFFFFFKFFETFEHLPDENRRCVFIKFLEFEACTRNMMINLIINFFIRNFHSHRRLRRLIIAQEFHDLDGNGCIYCDVIRYYRSLINEPNHRLTLSPRTNLIATLSLRVIFLLRVSNIILFLKKKKN